MTPRPPRSRGPVTKKMSACGIGDELPAGAGGICHQAGAMAGLVTARSAAGSPAVTMSGRATGDSLAQPGRRGRHHAGLWALSTYPRLAKDAPYIRSGRWVCVSDAKRRKAQRKGLMPEWGETAASGPGSAGVSMDYCVAVPARRNSQGGTGEGSAQRPRFSRRASASIWITAGSVT